MRVAVVAVAVAVAVVKCFCSHVETDCGTKRLCSTAGFTGRHSLGVRLALMLSTYCRLIATLKQHLAPPSSLSPLPLQLQQHQQQEQNDGLGHKT